MHRIAALAVALLGLWGLAPGVSALAAPSCPPGIAARPDAPPRGALPQPGNDAAPARVLWLGDAEALAWPSPPGAMISGEAGASAGGREECHLDLPAGYHAALRFTRADGPLTRIAFGVCREAGGQCEWVELARR